MKPRKVLFVCVHNSARSQMAEAFFNLLCGADWEAQSAGLEPGGLNPIVVEAMHEIGINISDKKTRAVRDVLDSGELYTVVVTVCSEAEAAGCPVFPGPAKRLHWPFPDPTGFTGDHEEKRERTREVRDAIKAKITSWCAELRSLSE
ncbi:MAG: arsenate reductase ArsC [Chthoniobacterales bacterium]